MTPNDPPLAQRDPELAPAAPVCPVCGDPHRHRTGLEPSSPYLDEASYHIARCAGCGLLQTEPWPTPELLRQVYDSGNYYSTVEASATGTPNQPLIERARSGAARKAEAAPSESEEKGRGRRSTPPTCR